MDAIILQFYFFFHFISLTVEEALILLEQLSDDEEIKEADICICPPSQVNDITDEDSGPDDSVDVERLSGQHLRSSAALTLRKVNQGKGYVGEFDSSTDNDDSEQPPPSKRKKIKKKITERNWIKKDIPISKKKNISWNVQKPDFLNVDWSPVTIFGEIITDEILDEVVLQTILYARQKNNTTFSVTREELRLFLAILLTSGYACLPQRRLYWSPSIDVNNTAISSAMCRNRFEQIMQYLHFADNTKLDKKDKVAKLRPLFCMLNERFLFLQPRQQQLSVDESMVPYYGRHNCKQFIRGKPIRFGYKVWCLNTRLGYLVQFEPYQGAGTVDIIEKLGMGGSVVVDLISELPEHSNIDLYCDNLFTSPELIDYLSKKGYNVTGTVRANRCEKCPLKNVALLKKEKRGTFEYMFDEKQNNVLLVRWNDNNVVTIASNVHGVYPLVKAKRWSNSEKKIIEIDQPNVVAQYNHCMGGTDRMDQNIGNYRCSIRSKKWWWPLFIFGLEAAVQNAWQLYRECPSSNNYPLQLLQFRREICLAYFQKYTLERNLKPGRTVGEPGKLKSRVSDLVRYDGEKHYVAVNKTQIRCGHCGKKVYRKCIKCNVGLHDKCFVNFHTKEN